MKQTSIILTILLMSCRHTTTEPAPIAPESPSIQGKVLTLDGIPLQNVTIGLKFLTLSDTELFQNGYLKIDSSLIGDKIVALDRTNEDGIFTLKHAGLSQPANLFAFRKGFSQWYSIEHQDSVREYEIRLEDLRRINVDTTTRIRFTAIVDIPDNRNPFSLSNGDAIIGEYWYSYIPTTYFGWYPQDSTSGGLILPLGSHTFRADPAAFPQYDFRVRNNSSEYGLGSDYIEFQASDPSLARDLGADRVHVAFRFLDFTSTLLDDESLPMSINSDWFENPSMFLNGSTDSTAHLNWFIRLAIVKLEIVN